VNLIYFFSYYHRTERLDDEVQAKREEEHSGGAGGDNPAGGGGDQNKGGNLRYTNSGVEVPMANGNVIKIPVTSDLPQINISEEVNRSGVWKSLEGYNATSTKVEETELSKKSAG